MTTIEAMLEPARTSKSAVRRVMDFVESAVRNRSFEDGRLPSEPEIAGLVGVSRTPVREAMKILDAMGVIEIRRGVGTFLSPQATSALGYLMMFQTVTQTASSQQLFEARLMVEQAAAELASMRRTDEDLVALRAANAELERLARAPVPDLDAVTEADIDFHKLVFDVCDNPLIATIGKLTIEQVRPWIRVSHEAEGPLLSVQIHERIIEAIERKDAGEARHSASIRAVRDGLESWHDRLPPR